jgi:hypothetical protein
MIGQPLRIIYKTTPRLFTSETDVITTATGTAGQLRGRADAGRHRQRRPHLDISRAQVSSVEQSDRSRVVPPYAGVNVGKYVMAMFQQRLANEATSLRRQYRTRITRKF